MKGQGFSHVNTIDDHVIGLLYLVALQEGNDVVEEPLGKVKEDVNDSEGVEGIQYSCYYDKHSEHTEDDCKA